MDKYEVIIFWSNEDQVYIADIPELPGCMAHGDTEESARANAKDAMAFWLETARELDRPIPQPKGRRLMFA